MCKIFGILYLFIFGLELVPGYPLCEIQDESNLDRAKRFTFLHSSHKNMTISYKITDYSKKFSHTDVDNVISRAFNIWSEHTDLRFIRKEANEEAIITLRFAVREHGDKFPFDGPGNVLAHAGKEYVHFDDDENWKVKNEAEGTSLFRVAVHEIGHSLGLGHSDEADAIMFFAHLADDEEQFRLDQDDINGIQAIYGKKAGRPVFDEDLCKDPTFDTMFDTPDEKLYIFKKDKYYEMGGTSIKAGPSSISAKWTGLPGDINGAFSKNGKTFFFKGEDYWRFTGDTMDSDYPQKLARWYSQIPNDIDDVTVWKDGKIYFFKGNKFYRIDDFKEESTTVYQNEIATEWKDIPNNLDSVHYSLFWHLTFFFKIDTFYAFETEHDVYKINTNTYFFNCPRP